MKYHLKRELKMLLTFLNFNLLSETIILCSLKLNLMKVFQTVRFWLKVNSFAPFRFDRIKWRGGVVLHIREYIPAKVICYDFPFAESLLVKINLHKRKWLFNCSYNPPKNNITKHLELISSPADTDVFKTSSGRLRKVMTSYDQTSRDHDSGKRRRIYDVLKTPTLRRFEDVWFTTSSGRLIYDVLKTSDLSNLEDVQFATSWKCLIYSIFRTSDLRRLEDDQFTSSWRCPVYDVLKTSDLWRLEDFCKTTSVQQRRSDVYATSKEMIFSYFVLFEIFRKF